MWLRSGCECKRKHGSNNQQKQSNGNYGAGQSSDKVEPAILCTHCIHNWTKCPNNKANRDKVGTSTKVKEVKRGEADSMEMWQSRKDRAPIIHYESEDKKSVTISDIELVGEVMEVVGDTTSKALHPMII